MRCVICRHGETEPGVTTVTLERGALTLVVKGVPGEVCANCGEGYVEGRVVRTLLEDAESKARAGVIFELDDYGRKKEEDP